MFSQHVRRTSKDIGQAAKILFSLVFAGAKDDCAEIVVKLEQDFKEQAVKTQEKAFWTDVVCHLHF